MAYLPPSQALPPIRPKIHPPQVPLFLGITARVFHVDEVTQSSRCPPVLMTRSMASLQLPSNERLALSNGEFDTVRDIMGSLVQHILLDPSFQLAVVNLDTASVPFFRQLTSASTYQPDDYLCGDDVPKQDVLASMYYDPVLMDCTERMLENIIANVVSELNISIQI